VSAAKQNPHRPGIAPALGLRAGGDDLLIVSETASQREIPTMMLFFSRRLPSKRPVLRRPFVPRLESLEDRMLPSTLTVLNNLDSGTGSLRAAITSAKSGDTILFASSLNGQTITLTSGELAISKSLDIEGPGASFLAVSGNNAFRVFDVSQGLTVTIAGMTVTHGVGTGDLQDNSQGGGGGGGLLNGGSTVNLANDVFSCNQAEHGGAITNVAGSVLSALSCSFIANRAVGTIGSAYVEGGAIWNTDHKGVGATATIIGCTFIGNQALGQDDGRLGGTAGALGETNGGAIHSGGQSFLTVKNSMFIANQAIAGNGADASKASGPYVVDAATGGAIANDEGQHLVIDGCTFSFNEAIGGSNAIGSSSGSGRIGHALGGAVQTSGSATITNSTFDHNKAIGGNNNTGGSGTGLNGRGAGGAIGSFSFGFTFPVSLTVSNCTFTDNQAVGGSGNAGGLVVGTGVGGGIANDRGSTATVTGCTFTGNEAIGGAGGIGQNAADGLGGGIANVLGSTLTVHNCMLSSNQAFGGAGGAAANGGNGFGAGIFNDGLSVWPANAGTAATLTVAGSTITGNQATGGAAGTGGNAGHGIGGGVYFVSGGEACLDTFTVAHVTHNHASTSADDILGVFTIC
jgi:hypothetical protein